MHVIPSPTIVCSLCHIHHVVYLHALCLIEHRAISACRCTLQDDLLQVTTLTTKFPQFVHSVIGQVKKLELPMPFCFSTLVVRPTLQTDQILDLDMFRGPILLVTCGSEGRAEPGGDRSHCKQ